MSQKVFFRCINVILKGYLVLRLGVRWENYLELVRYVDTEKARTWGQIEDDFRASWGSLDKNQSKWGNCYRFFSCGQDQELNRATLERNSKHVCQNWDSSSQCDAIQVQTESLWAGEQWLSRNGWDWTGGIMI